MLWNYNGPSCSSDKTRPIKAGDIVVSRNRDFSGNVTTSNEMNKAMNYHIGRVVNFAPVSVSEFGQIADVFKSIDTGIRETKYPLCSLSYEVVENSSSPEQLHLDNPLEFQSSYQKAHQKTANAPVKFYGVVCRFDKAQDVLTWFNSSPHSSFVRKMYNVRLKVTELFADCYLYRVMSMDGDLTFGKNLRLKPVFPYANFDTPKLREPRMLEEVVELTSYYPHVLRKNSLYYTTFLRPESVQFLAVDQCREGDLDDIIEEVESKYMSYYKSTTSVFGVGTAQKIHERVQKMNRHPDDEASNQVSNKEKILDMIHNIQAEILKT